MNGVSFIQENLTKLLTSSEAAEILGIKKETLNVWRTTKRYDLNFIKVGRLVMYRKEDIAEFIKKRSISCAE